MGGGGGRAARRRRLTGRAFGIFDIALVVPWMLLLSLVPDRATAGGGGGGRSARRAGYRGSFWAIATVLVVAALSLGYFFHSRRSRTESAGPGAAAAITGWSEELYGVDLPAGVELDLYYLARYASVGYYGLAGCLDLPFEWTGGFGHSLFLTRYAELLTPRLAWVRNATYPVRLEAATGTSSFAAWHTAYAWLASDLTFPGALLFVGLVAFLTALAWSDALAGRGPFAIGFAAQGMLFLYYLPANNLRMGNPEAAFALYGLLAFWLLTRGATRSTGPGERGARRSPTRGPAGRSIPGGVRVVTASPPLASAGRDRLRQPDARRHQQRHAAAVALRRPPEGASRTGLLPRRRSPPPHGRRLRGGLRHRPRCRRASRRPPSGEGGEEPRARGGREALPAKPRHARPGTDRHAAPVGAVAGAPVERPTGGGAGPVAAAGRAPPRRLLTGMSATTR